MKKLLLLIAIVFSTNVFAVEFKGKFLQGHFIIGITDPGSKIIVDKKEVRVSEEGFFVFGIDRDRKFDVTITKITNEKKEKIIKTVLKRKYNIQRIDGLEESKVTPPESVYKRIKKENNAIGEARAINSDLNYFKNKFIMPVEGIITGVYGSQRILNGVAKRPHYGIDIANKEGTEISSPSDGVIVLAEKDLFFSGGTIIISHGMGLTSSLLHLSEIFVKVGDKVKIGEKIGRVGSTGRSTGPHLDWRMEINGTRIDPQLLIKNK